MDDLQSLRERFRWRTEKDVDKSSWKFRCRKCFSTLTAKAPLPEDLDLIGAFMLSSGMRVDTHSDMCGGALKLVRRPQKS